MLVTWSQLHWLDVLAVVWLMSCWLGYSVFARTRARHVHCIASVLHKYRIQWMLAMLRRDNRIADASLLSNLERNASFLASTAIFVIAGLVTSLASVEKVHEMLSTIPFAQQDFSPAQLQIKITLVLLIFIYSFFTFTWAMRQYGFCAVVVGAAPLSEDPLATGEEGQRFARYAAKIIDQAGHSYNYGLRSYYFSLSILAWLINTWVFILAVGLVVAVLYGREFHSKTLKALKCVGNLSD